MPDFIRLDRALSAATGLSRQQSARLVRSGAVSVDGVPASDPGLRVLRTALISCPVRTFTPQLALAPQYYLLNKPAGYVCADRDTRHPVAADLLPAGLPRRGLHCVGRLDADTLGLLLMTDDGDFSHRVCSPRGRIPKVYEALLQRPLTQADITSLASGLKHPDEPRPYLPAVAAPGEGCLARITVTEGRFHEVKRLFECTGNTVLRLKRVQIGGLMLPESLPPGGLIRLEPREAMKVFAKAPAEEPR